MVFIYSKATFISTFAPKIVLLFNAQFECRVIPEALLAASSTCYNLSRITYRDVLSLPTWKHIVPTLHYHIVQIPSFAHAAHLPDISYHTARQHAPHLTCAAPHSSARPSVKDFPMLSNLSTHTDLPAPFIEWIFGAQIFVYSISSPWSASAK